MDKATEAMDLLLAGWTYAAIGKRLGISRQRVQQLIRPPAPIVALVRTRAKSKCQDCGLLVQHGHVHHANANGIGRESFTDIANLVYLCVSCHRQRHAWIGMNAERAANRTFVNARKQLRLTQAALARRTGISRADITCIELRGWIPPVDLQQRLAEALDVPVESLFTPQAVTS